VTAHGLKELDGTALAPVWARATGTCDGGRAPSDRVREPSRYDDRVFALLEHHGVALCLHDMQRAGRGHLLVGPFIDVRFHVGESKYGGAYDDARLDEWRRGSPIGSMREKVGKSFDVRL
jgi:hypothetical protein